MGLLFSARLANEVTEWISSVGRGLVRDADKGAAATGGMALTRRWGAERYRWGGGRRIGSQSSGARAAGGRPC